MSFEHAPVLLAETLELLAVRPGGRYCDVTVGGGGHAEGILELSAPSGKLLGIDRDPEAVEYCRQRLSRFGDRVALRHAPFSQLEEAIQSVGWPAADGIVADLGVSSHQLDTESRGFSFMRSGPLDMRMDTESPLTLERFLSNVREEELADVIYEYGEERQSRRVARAIKEALRTKSLASTQDLATTVCRAVGTKGRPWSKQHPATRTFQALRIALNGELEELDQLLAIAPRFVKPGGRLVMISFHSLEDRKVKRAFASWAKKKSQESSWTDKAITAATKPQNEPHSRILTRKPICASLKEIQENPRARSARLRAVERFAA